MNIRHAKPTEATIIAPLVYSAIHDIAYSLTGTTDEKKMLERLSMWINRPENRLSYENIIVAEIEEAIAGIIITYPGELASKLDEPIQNWLIEQGHVSSLDAETEGCVLYIDSVAVDAQYGGRGIGTQLIQAAIDRARSLHLPYVTLNVDKTNPNASRLYERLGFNKTKEITISGGQFDYMELKV